MKTIRTIGTIAWFEMLVLFRSWFFRIFTGLILLVLLVMNIAIFKDNSGNWAVQGIGSNIPYFNTLVLSLAQAFIAMFLALDFLKRDKKLDTSEVIFTRSMSNWAYTWGKTAGILGVFLVLNLLVLLLTLIINLIMGQVAIDWAAYLYYPLLIGLPSLLFILGLSFIVMSILNNQAISLVFLLGYTGMVLFFGKDKFDFIFDFMGFRLPMIHSDMIGFGYESKMLLQRGIYLFFGLSFISGSILLMKRLPQSKGHTLAAWILAVTLGLAGIGGIFAHVGSTLGDEKFRTDMITLNDKNAGTPVLSSDSCDLNIRHQGNRIAVTARMSFSNANREAVTKTVFSLNPGFTLEDVKVNGSKVSFERNHHLVFINLPVPLLTGQKADLEFSYQGAVDERVCNLDIKSEQAHEDWGPSFLISVRKRFAIIEPDYVLLTPECAWYPVPGVLHGSTLAVLPTWNFTRFSATVETKSTLQPIMQGKTENKGTLWTFTPENPLPGMSLIIGHYQPKTLKTEGVDFELNIIKGHDYFSSVLDSVSDTLPRFVGDLKQDLERRLGLKYAYPRLRLVEVPMQYYAYSRLWVKHRDFLQPEMVLVPEMGSMLSRAGFALELKQSIQRSKLNEESLTEKEIQLRVLRNFISENFMPGSSDNRMMFGGGGSFSANSEKKYNLFPHFFTFVNHLGSKEYPILNTAIEAYLSNSGESMMGGFGMNASALSASEQANHELQKKSFKKLLGSEMDNLALRQVIDAKGKYLFTFFEAVAGSDNFMPFLVDEITKYRYHTLDFDQFANDFKSSYHFNVDSLTRQWYEAGQLPGYLIGHVRVIEVQEGERTRYQMLYEVSNPSKEGGLLQITLRSGGRGGMGGGSRGGGGFGGGRGGSTFALAGRDASTNRFLIVPPGQGLQVGYVLDDQPRMMSVNTLISTNLPNNISYPFPNLEKIKGYEPFDGQKTIPLVMTMSEPGEIVVDNEDVGFSTLGQESVSRLARWLKINETNTDIPYENMRTWRPPIFWTPIIQSGFYGDFIRSAVYIKAGTGDLKVEWRTLIQKPGYYDVYAYINPNIARMGIRMGGAPGSRPGAGGPGQMPEITDEYHYFVFHAEGEEDVTVSLKSAETGWNKLGTFYFESDTAKVLMNDKNTGRTVVADAIKWVKQQ